MCKQTILIPKHFTSQKMKQKHTMTATHLEERSSKNLTSANIKNSAKVMRSLADTGPKGLGGTSAIEFPDSVTGVVGVRGINKEEEETGTIPVKSVNDACLVGVFTI
jgi:hypothetical protein